jgi:hypothetical protein
MLLINENNAENRKRWCGDYKTWTFDGCKYVICSDESSITLFPTSSRVYIWRTPKEAYNPECLIPTMKHGGRSVMIWAAIPGYSAGPIIILNCRITASDYVDNSGNGVHPIVHMLLLNNDAIFKMTLPIHTVRSAQSWFQKHEDALKHLPWPAQ